MAASVTPQEGGRERESEKETEGERVCVREREQQSNQIRLQKIDRESCSVNEQRGDGSFLQEIYQAGFM